MPKSSSSRAGIILLVASALAGLALALYAYFTPLTGVTGTIGALAPVAVSAIVAVLALLLTGVDGRAGRIVLRLVILIGLAGNVFAGVLLQEWWVCIAMAVGFVGLLIDMLSSRAAY